MHILNNIPPLLIAHINFLKYIREITGEEWFIVMQLAKLYVQKADPEKVMSYQDAVIMSHHLFQSYSHHEIMTDIQFIKNNL